MSTKFAAAYQRRGETLSGGVIFHPIEITDGRNVFEQGGMILEDLVVCGDPAGYDTIEQAEAAVDEALRMQTERIYQRRPTAISPIQPVSCSEQVIKEAVKLPTRRQVDFVAAALAAREIMTMQAHDMAAADGHLRAPAMYLIPLEDAYAWQWLRECAKRYLAYARHNRVTVEIWPSEAGCPKPPKED